MRELITDFMRLYPQPDGSVRIPLGFAGQAPDLEGLAEGERVRFVDPGQLEAEGIVRSETDGNVPASAVGGASCPTDTEPHTILAPRPLRATPSSRGVTTPDL